MPFLATMTGASAGMVSIVAGFLVSRFVGLDSEQQTNERELDELEEELATARDRAEKARAKWVRFEAQLIFEDDRVLDAVCEGTIDAETLRRRCPTPLSDEDLDRIAQEVRRHYVEAFDTLDSLLRSHPNIATMSARQLEGLADWDSIRSVVERVPAAPEWPDVWEHALSTPAALIDR